MSAPDIDYLRSRFSYDPVTGALIWKALAGDSKEARRFNTRHAGTRAGTLNPKGYLKVQLESKLYPAHAIAWAIHYGEWPESLLDHRDGFKSNNAIDNLRRATKSENASNKAICNKTGFKRGKPQSIANRLASDYNV